MDTSTPTTSRDAQHKNGGQGAYGAPWLPYVFLFGIVLLAYLPAYHGGFILDDDLLLTNSPLIKDAQGWWHVWWTTKTPDYLPVMSDSFWIEWRLFGMNPTGYHISNIIQHAISTVLVWLILKRMNVPGAWFAALLFGIHPVNVRSVAWIAERKNTLSMVFYLATILAFLKSDTGRDRRWYAAALGIFVLALLSKSSTVVLPAVLLIVIWFQARRIRRSDIIAVLPFAGLALCACATTIWFQNVKEIAPAHVVSDPRLWRFASSGMAVWFYLGKLIAPVHLAMIYPRWTINTGNLLSFAPLAGVLVTLAVLYRYRHGWAGGAFAAFTYYVVTLLPVLGFVNMAFFKSSLVSDHLQYIPMIGIVALAAVPVGLAVKHQSWKVRSPVAYVATLVAYYLAIATWHQAGLYQSREALAKDTLRTNPASFWAHGELANALAARNDLGGAERELLEVIRLEPTSIAAYNNLAMLYARNQDDADALTMLGKAMELAPDSFAVRMNFGIMEARTGDLATARQAFTAALALAPDRDAAKQANDWLARVSGAPMH